MIFIICAMIYGGLVSRWHGGWGFKASKTVKNLAWALPFGFVAASHFTGIASIAAILIAATALCLAGKATGHGGFMDLGTWPKPREDERVEFVIKQLRGEVPEPFYDYLGLMIVGFLAVSGLFLALMLKDPLCAALVAACGMAKGTAYAVGWMVRPSNTFADGTAGAATTIGEVLTGVIAFLGLGVAYVA